MINNINKEIQKNTTKEDYICVAGDFNEAIGTNPKLMAKVCTTNNQYNTFNHAHPHLINTPTYSRGIKNLDCILLSKNSPSPIATGINPYNLLYTSDNRALFIDLDVTNNFWNLKEITPNGLWELKSNSKLGTDMIKETYIHLDENNMFEQFYKYEQDIKP